MKIIMDKISDRTQIFTDGGEEIKGVVSVNLTARVGDLVRAELELVCIDASLFGGEPSYIVGNHRDIVALIDKDGNKINLAEAEAEQNEMSA